MARSGLQLACALGAVAAAAAAAASPASVGDAGAKTGWLAAILPASMNGSGTGVALVNAIAMIIATEIGDKTFCIAAVMAMRYNRVFVFGGAIGALIVMTILSVVIGVAVPTLLSRTYTHYAAAGLFAYFGYKLLREAREMTAGGELGELRETEAELGLGTPSADESGEGAGAKAGSGETEALTASGGGSGTVENMSGQSPSSGGGGDVESGDSNGKGADKARGVRRPVGTLPMLLHYCKKDWAILTQAFTLTFLAEWGDRSQIATIAMAAAQDPVGITLGAVIGHSMCTGLAVLGGRILAARISEKTVATAGGVLFLLFSAHSFVVGPEQ